MPEQSAHRGSRGIITTNFDNLTGTDAVSVLKDIESLGYDSFWIPELFGREPMATAGYLLAKTDRIKIASGIANIYARDPHSAAQARHSLAEFSGGRFIFGLGVSNAGINQMRGHAWEAPIGKMGGYLDAVSKVEVASAAPNALGPMYLAAHGPNMQALASSKSDGVITYLMSPEHTALTKSRVRPEADINVVCMLLAETDPVKARAVARDSLAFYMGLDYYHREWKKMGFSEADYADGGSDALIDMLVGWGDTESLNNHLRKHEEAGATRIVIMPLSADGSVSGDRNPVLEAAAPT